MWDLWKVSAPFLPCCLHKQAEPSSHVAHRQCTTADTLLSARQNLDTLIPGLNETAVPLPRHIGRIIIDQMAEQRTLKNDIAYSTALSLLEKSWLRKYGGNKAQGWTMTQDVTCTTGTLYSLFISIHLHTFGVGKFGGAWVPCLCSIKIELMWDIPVLHKEKAKAPFTSKLQLASVPSTQCRLLFSKPSGPTKLGGSTTEQLWKCQPWSLSYQFTSTGDWSATHWVASVLGLSLWEAKNRAEHIDPCNVIRYSPWILTCCQLQDTKTLRQSL